MAKKKIDKEAERTPSSPGKIVSIFKNETVHFVLGLMLVIFSVYLLLAFSSFFFTGAADQSIIDSGSSADLAAVNNNVQPINHFHRRTMRTRISFNPATARKTRIKKEDIPKQSFIR